MMRPNLAVFGLAIASAALGGCASGADHVPEYPAKPGAVFRDCPWCPELVVIGPGEFKMGRDGGEKDRFEGPVHSVRIRRAFALGRFEVTNAPFERFVRATGELPAGPCAFFDGNDGYFDSKRTWRDPGYGRAPQPNEPVVCVSWRDAQAFLRWLSAKTGQTYRLPSEAEWEYAARSSPDRDTPWGKEEAEACRYANVLDRSYARERSVPVATADCDDGFPIVAPVGSFPPNPRGLYDIVGNVWEWVRDCYVVPYPPDAATETPVEVSGECHARAVRGGSWLTRPDRQRVTWRGRDPEDSRSWLFGFRVAREFAQ